MSLNKIALCILTASICCFSHAQYHGQDQDRDNAGPVPHAYTSIRMDSTLMVLNSMTVEDYLAIELPPLEELFENARNMSNVINYYREDVQFYKGEVLTQKMRPLEWIRGLGSLTYGNTSMVGLLQNEISYPVWNQSTSKQQSLYYNVGFTVNIPISDFITIPSKIKQAKAKQRVAEYRMETEMDNIKQDIIDYYCEVIGWMKELQTASEKLVIARTQYEFAEANFVINKATSEELYRCKSYESSAIHDFENVKKELNKALLKLEIISCTKIITK